MLVNFKSILRYASEKAYAIGGFNVTNLETAIAILEAAATERSPVILQITEKTIREMKLDLAFAIAKTLADRAEVPVVVHLDHGRDLELVNQAIEIGFSSVMIDVSLLPPKERIPIVQAVVRKAHRRGVSVEAEEDKIAGREDLAEGRAGGLTDPIRAKGFVDQTSCDAFAVSIGNSHGVPLANESLDLELLREIHRQVSVPLVLHGASSTPEAVIRQAISLGVAKINIDTDLRLAFTRRLRQTLHDRDLIDPRDELRPSKEEVRKVVQEKIRLFGSSGKA